MLQPVAAVLVQRLAAAQDRNWMIEEILLNASEAQSPDALLAHFGILEGMRALPPPLIVEVLKWPHVATQPKPRDFLISLLAREPGAQHLKTLWDASAWVAGGHVPGADIAAQPLWKQRPAKPSGS